MDFQNTSHNPEVYDYNSAWANPGYQTFPPDGFFGENVTVTPQIPHLGAQYRVVEDEPLVQTFFEGPKKCDCCINWVEKQPTQMPEHARQRYDRASICVYKKKDHSIEAATVGGLIAMKHDSVEIQSPVISDLIRPILIELGRLTPEKDKIKIHAPFRELFFAYPKVSTLRDEQQEDSNERRHLDVLIKVMDELFSDISKEVTELHAKKAITQKYVWTLFQKNIIVYSRRHGLDRLYQVVDTHSGRDKSSRITCRSVQFDGNCFGRTTMTIRIPHFKGAKLISSLPVYPVGFHSDSRLEAKLFERGKRVLYFQSIRHCEYNGFAISATAAYRWTESDLRSTSESDLTDSDEEYYRHRRRYYRSPTIERTHISGRIVIDAFGFAKHKPYSAIETEPIEADEIDDSIGRPSLQPTKLSLSQASQHDKRRLTLAEQTQNRNMMLEKRNDLLVMSPWLPGYSLKLNEWFWFYVDRLRPVSWNEDAFDHLVLPEMHKTTLLTHVKNYKPTETFSDDIITGKGLGLVVLLSGPPGTGKTLTAEAVADKSKRPLLRLQASNLASNATEIGNLLSKALELSEEWNSLLLLDEADTFIKERSIGHDTLYDITSGILRQIEYFRGIIFLTSNLQQNIDTALRSRIHIHMQYSPFTKDLRLRLWKTFLSRLDLALPLPPADTSSHENLPCKSSSHISVDVSPSDLEELSAWSLNGREIKNIVKTVHLWCIYKQCNISLTLIEDGINMTAPFSEKAPKIRESSGARKRPRVDERNELV